MKIKRIDSDKTGMRSEVKRIEIIQNDVKFAITEERTGGLRIHRDTLSGELIIKPCVSNEIIIQ